MAAGLRPALNDAQMMFTRSSGFEQPPYRPVGWDLLVAVIRLCRSISSLMASRNFRSSASSRYSNNRQPSAADVQFRAPGASGLK
jgi:hypothetical protein